jgi:hypothetical protein
MLHVMSWQLFTYFMWVVGLDVDLSIMIRNVKRINQIISHVFGKDYFFFF